MGLDMYLKASKYLSDWHPDQQKVKAAVNALVPDHSHIEIHTIEGEAIYWRKANAIHAWFVKNVQDGKDDCGTYYASREKLAELRDTLATVLEDHSQAAALLPTQEGFFFGGTDIDRYYYEQLERTRDRLTVLLGEEYKEWDFHYTSSW